MIKEKGGSYQAKLHLAPGEYRCRFVIDGRWHEDPEAELLATLDDGAQTSSVRG